MNIQIQNKEYWDNLIIDYLSGNITDKDQIILNKWLSESDKHHLYYESLKDIWNSSGIADNTLSFDYEKAFSLFEKRIRSLSKQNSKKSWFQKRLVWSKIGAAAILIPFIFLTYYTFLYFKIQDNTISLSEIISPKGSRTQVKLADGTILWLNSGSSVQYNNDFGKGNRILSLSGEAYLEVAKNEQLPFVVKAGELEVKVLGTIFNVNAYPDNKEIKVSLLQGCVSLSKNGETKTTILKPLETGIYNINSHQISVDPYLPKEVLSWMNGRFIFNGETFEEITRILERNFNIEITIHTEDLKNKRFG